MQFHYHESNTGADLHYLRANDRLEHRDPGTEKRPLLTIGWNRGADQTVWIDDVPYPLANNQVVLLINDHRYKFEQAVDVTAWRFNRDFYCIIDHDAEVGCAGILFYGMPSPMLLHLDTEANRRLDLLSLVFEDEFATHDNIQGEMLRMLLKRLIILLTRIAKKQHLKTAPQGEEFDLIRQFNVLVEKHFKEKKQVQDYADLLYKSPKTLSNLFGKYSDKTPLQVIRERVVTEAKRLLRFTDKPVAEIGYDLGFPESAHFGRFFKRVEGVSPGAFRKNF